MRLDGRPSASAVARASARGSRTPALVGAPPASARAAAAARRAASSNSGSSSVGSPESVSTGSLTRRSASAGARRCRRRRSGPGPGRQSWLRDPEPAAAVLLGRGRSRPDQRVVDAAAVADGADQLPVARPRCGGSPLPPPCWMLLVATSQTARTRSSLRRRVEPGGSGRTGRRGGAPIARSPLSKFSVTAGAARAVAERPPRAGSRASSAGRRTLPVRAGADGVAALGPRAGPRSRGLAGVVWAHHRQWPLLGEGEVEEPLVQLALFHLGRAAVRRRRVRPRPRTPRCRSQVSRKSRQAGISRAGLRPTSPICQNSTSFRGRPSASRTSSHASVPGGRPARSPRPQIPSSR